jgi:hypothetical protein
MEPDMTPLIVGITLILIGAVLAAAEVRACEFERKNIGLPIAAFGAVLTLAASLDALF